MDVEEGIARTARRLSALSGEGETLEAMRATGVCGFTVCAPRGADLPQRAIREALDGVLRLGYPTALYQLPQITENEIAPETFSALTAAYPNFYLFKDTSGTDAVVLSGADRYGVYTVRGGEGDYDRWYPADASGGGARYDGFLLGSANCFARELRSLLGHIDAGEKAAAADLSRKLSRVVVEGIAAASPLPFGNAFANSNKAFDHYFAFGPGAGRVEPPMTHSGKRLPEALVLEAGALLEREGLMPERGYLES